MKKTKAYPFRGYIIHVPEELFVYIGNDETEFLIYHDQKTYTLMATLKWLASRNSLKCMVSWNIWFEHELDNSQYIYIHYDPDFNY